MFETFRDHKSTTFSCIKCGKINQGVCQIEFECLRLNARSWREDYHDEHDDDEGEEGKQEGGSKKEVYESNLTSTF